MSDWRFVARDGFLTWTTPAVPAGGRRLHSVLSPSLLLGFTAPGDVMPVEFLKLASVTSASLRNSVAVQVERTGPGGAASQLLLVAETPADAREWLDAILLALGPSAAGGSFVTAATAAAPTPAPAPAEAAAAAPAKNPAAAAAPPAAGVVEPAASDVSNPTGAAAGDGWLRGSYAAVDAAIAADRTASNASAGLGQTPSGRARGSSGISQTPPSPARDTAGEAPAGQRAGASRTGSATNPPHPLLAMLSGGSRGGSAVNGAGRTASAANPLPPQPLSAAGDDTANATTGRTFSAGPSVAPPLPHDPAKAQSASAAAPFQVPAYAQDSSFAAAQREDGGLAIQRLPADSSIFNAAGTNDSATLVTPIGDVSVSGGNGNRYRRDSATSDASPPPSGLLRAQPLAQTTMERTQEVEVVSRANGHPLGAGIGPGWQPGATIGTGATATADGASMIHHASPATAMGGGGGHAWTPTVGGTTPYAAIDGSAVSRTTLTLGPGGTPFAPVLSGRPGGATRPLIATTTTATAAPSGSSGFRYSSRSNSGIQQQPQLQPPQAQQYQGVQNAVTGSVLLGPQPATTGASSNFFRPQSGPHTGGAVGEAGSYGGALEGFNATPGSAFGSNAGGSVGGGLGPAGVGLGQIGSGTGGYTYGAGGNAGGSHTSGLYTGGVATTTSSPLVGARRTGMLVDLPATQHVNRNIAPNPSALWKQWQAPDGTLYVMHEPTKTLQRYVPGADGFETLVDENRIEAEAAGMELPPLPVATPGDAMMDMSTMTVRNLQSYGAESPEHAALHRGGALPPVPASSLYRQGVVPRGQFSPSRHAAVEALATPRAATTGYQGRRVHSLTLSPTATADGSNVSLHPDGTPSFTAVLQHEVQSIADELSGAAADGAAATAANGQLVRALGRGASGGALVSKRPKAAPIPRGLGQAGSLQRQWEHARAVLSQGRYFKKHSLKMASVTSYRFVFLTPDTAWVCAVPVSSVNVSVGATDGGGAGRPPQQYFAPDARAMAVNTIDHVSMARDEEMLRGRGGQMNLDNTFVIVSRTHALILESGSAEEATFFCDMWNFFLYYSKPIVPEPVPQIQAPVTHGMRGGIYW